MDSESLVFLFLESSLGTKGKGRFPFPIVREGPCLICVFATSSTYVDGHYIYDILWYQSHFGAPSVDCLYPSAKGLLAKKEDYQNMIAN